jgi:uncharacterized cofD-like protein
MRNIVIIGGGTGTSTLLQGLKKYPVDLSVIVSTADDGGSTGILRKELGVIPPGDIRQCLLALSDAPKEVKELFNFRFSSGNLKGHNAGNIILAALEKISGIEEGVSLASKMLNVRGQVLPVSLTPTTLSAILQNGKKIVGEHFIDDRKPMGKASPIKSLQLTVAKANPRALKALLHANAIVFGPGDLYTSVLPSLLVSGINGAINRSKAKKLLVTNIMTKFGQTDGFKASDFATEIEAYLKGKIDYVLANNKKPSQEILRKYVKEKAEFVETDINALAKTKAETIALNLLSGSIIKKIAGDSLKRSWLRHDSEKLAKIIWELIS